MRASIEIEIVGKPETPQIIEALHRTAEQVERILAIELDRSRSGTGGEVRAAVRLTDRR